MKNEDVLRGSTTSGPSIRISPEGSPSRRTVGAEPFKRGDPELDKKSFFNINVKKIRISTDVKTAVGASVTEMVTAAMTT